MLVKKRMSMEEMTAAKEPTGREGAAEGGGAIPFPTLISTFIPCSQWVPTEQTKYRVPFALRRTLTPLVANIIPVLVQFSYSSSLNTSVAVCVPFQLNTAKFMYTYINHHPI